ncbi:azurin [Psychroflexus maritimus]|uniref:Azurin n=1 Tax=Psychroflexus maritimus TaxID=2714865 RepID=A0A967AE26_9FLAO|nr:azurin [Psychroflexus maritimus]NGZ90371.1 azurin [Psychroflexus maritimus]
MKIVKLTMTMLLAVSLIACGDEQKKDENESKVSIGSQTEEREATPENTEESSDDELGLVELSLEGSDQMKFNKNQFKVKAGSEVKLTLTHTGQMSKEAMGHNFVLLNQGVDMMEFGERAAGAANNGYIPEDAGDDIIAHTDMIGGGESASVTFKAPEKGEYDFICSFPGHVALMKGKFIVE